MASDGLFDNLYPEDISQLIKTHINYETTASGGIQSNEDLQLRDPKLLSKQLAYAAEYKGYDPEYISPFSVEARRCGRKHKGGKADDITVIVAQVQAWKGK